MCCPKKSSVSKRPLGSFSLLLLMMTFAVQGCSSQNPSGQSTLFVPTPLSEEFMPILTRAVLSENDGFHIPEPPEFYQFCLVNFAHPDSDEEVLVLLENIEEAFLTWTSLVNPTLKKPIRLKKAVGLSERSNCRGGAEAFHSGQLAIHHKEDDDTGVQVKNQCGRFFQFHHLIEWQEGSCSFGTALRVVGEMMGFSRTWYYAQTETDREVGQVKEVSDFPNTVLSMEPSNQLTGYDRVYTRSWVEFLQVVRSFSELKQTQCPGGFVNFLPEDSSHLELDARQKSESRMCRPESPVLVQNIKALENSIQAGNSGSVLTPSPYFQPEEPVGNQSRESDSSTESLSQGGGNQEKGQSTQSTQTTVLPPEGQVRPEPDQTSPEKGGVMGCQEFLGSSQLFVDVPNSTQRKALIYAIGWNGEGPSPFPGALVVQVLKVEGAWFKIRPVKNTTAVDLLRDNGGVAWIESRADLFQPISASECAATGRN